MVAITRPSSESRPKAGTGGNDTMAPTRTDEPTRLTKRRLDEQGQVEDRSSPEVEREPAPNLGRTETESLPGHLKDALPLDVRPLGSGAAPGSVEGASVIARVPLGMLASGIVHLRTGETLAIGDDQGVCEVHPSRPPRLLCKLEDGEGIAASDDGAYVWTVEERKNRVRRFQVSTDESGRVALIDARADIRLPALGRRLNKGWEGLSFLPRALSGADRDWLVCVHEGSPRRIGLFELPYLTCGFTLKLPQRARDLLPDLADVVVDPSTGHLLVVSDQACTIVELAPRYREGVSGPERIEQLEIEAVSAIGLPRLGKYKPEGMAFDALGRLWVTLDDENEDEQSAPALVLALKRFDTSATRTAV